MALVVFLRGVNVGGHRRFQPAALARELAHLECVNIGAAGTFVVHGRIARTDLEREVARRLPFDTPVMTVDGRDIAGLIKRDVFRNTPDEREITRFVSVLGKTPRTPLRLPLSLPVDGPWELQVLGRDGRLVHGLYRRDMKAVRHLGVLDKLFGTPVTTRSWTTIQAIGRLL